VPSGPCWRARSELATPRDADHDATREHEVHEPDPQPLADLLDLARAAIAAAVDGRHPPVPDASADAALATPADAFVTLTEDGDLRGCMGTLGAGQPVGEAVVRAAGMAATRDPRFWPVDAGEMVRLHLEVSVLGSPRRLADVAQFVPGRDGIIVEARGRRALLLPQVATEMGWGTAEMLRAACEKAGLPADAWRDPATTLHVFEVARTAGPLVPAPTASTPA
jgi:AmmeMemoRadiSam system protein A